jgi:hypothetical protein
MFIELSFVRLCVYMVYGDIPSSLMSAATDVRVRLIDAANMSRSWSKDATYPSSRSARSVSKPSK